MKRFRTAVVFGKFWPLHVGHVRLIGHAIDASEQLLVVVNDGNEDVPTRVRVAWVADEFPSTVVVTAPDLCGHDTDECTAACSERYASWLTKNHGSVDAVFSGERYGELLASYLGATSVRLEREPSTAAGRAIRQDVVGHWEMLARPSRAWYCRRVVIVGAESTGTTTLALDVAHHLRTPCVPEYGRRFTEQHGLDHPWCSEDFDEIACRQVELEEDAARRSGPVLVCDTDALATALWHERYLGTRNKNIEEMASQRLPHMYVLTADDIPFVQDGMRDGEHLRAWMTQRFREVLSARSVPWAEVRGTRQERLQQVMSHIRERVTHVPCRAPTSLDCAERRAFMNKSPGGGR